MKRISAVENARYLIIGGTTKAATTSLFFYLREHPDVCAASHKETRFFLDPDRHLPSKYSWERDGLDKYDRYFSHCDRGKRLRVEATPDYLYSPGTPARIRHTLSNAKMLFIVREPVSRMISWYKFAGQRGLIAGDMTFDDFVLLQERSADGLSHVAQHLRPLEQGLYHGYLRRYFALFPPEGVLAIAYEDLASDPLACMQRICRFAGIDGEFYASFNFTVKNRSQNMKSVRLYGLYTRTRRRLRSAVHTMPEVHQFLRRILHKVEPYFMKWNAAPQREIKMSEDTKSFLETYYADEPRELGKLVENSKASWLTEAAK